MTSCWLRIPGLALALADQVDKLIREALEFTINELKLMNQHRMLTCKP